MLLANHNVNDKKRYPKLSLPRESSHCCTKSLILGLGANFSQFNSKNVCHGTWLLTCLKQDSSNKNKQNAVFSFDAWKSIHENTNKIRVVLIIVSGGSFDLSTATATDYWGRTGNRPRWHSLFWWFCDDLVMILTFLMMINNYRAVIIN